MKPKNTGLTDDGCGIGATDLHEASNMTSWGKMPEAVASSEVRDTEGAEEGTKNLNSLTGATHDDFSKVTTKQMAVVVPNKI